jgi:oligopeptide/dipeptide ABC transporter ATP-binding protein
MYAGKIVEKCSTRELISNPIMPYTEALMNSAPSLADAPHTRLKAIPGLPPNLLNLPEGCSFSSRCSYKDQKCINDVPDLTLLKNTKHSFACWYPLAQSATKPAFK